MLDFHSVLQDEVQDGGFGLEELLRSMDGFLVLTDRTNVMSHTEIPRLVSRLNLVLDKTRYPLLISARKPPAGVAEAVTFADIKEISLQFERPYTEYDETQHMTIAASIAELVREVGRFRASIRTPTLQTPAAKEARKLQYRYTRVDSEEIKFSATETDDEKPEIVAATIDRAIERLTYEKYPYPKLVSSFMLCYRQYTTPDGLFSLLLKRFDIEPPAGQSPMALTEWQTRVQIPVRLRVFNLLKIWIEVHFYDFVADANLLVRLRTFVAGPLTAHNKTLAEQLVKMLTRQESTVNMDAPLTSSKPKPPLPAKKPGAKKLRTNDIDPAEMARQFTIQDFNLFRRIPLQEFLSWAKLSGSSRANVPNIAAVVAQFNTLSSFVKAEIVVEEKLRNRAAMIARWITVADECLSLNNLNSVVAILGSLEDVAIYRLRKSWKLVPPRVLQRYEDLKPYVDARANYSRLRNFVRTCTPPLVPYLGSYLTELTFIEDGKRDLLDGVLMNCEKMRMINDIVMELRQYQVAKYNLNVVPAIADFISTLKIIPDEVIYMMSRKQEPQASAIANQASGAPTSIARMPSDRVVMAAVTSTALSSGAPAVALSLASAHVPAPTSALVPVQSSGSSDSAIAGDPSSDELSGVEVNAQGVDVGAPTRCDTVFVRMSNSPDSYVTSRKSTLSSGPQDGEAEPPVEAARRSSSESIPESDDPRAAAVAPGWRRRPSVADSPTGGDTDAAEQSASPREAPNWRRRTNAPTRSGANQAAPTALSSVPASGGGGNEISGSGAALATAAATSGPEPLKNSAAGAVSSDEVIAALNKLTVQFANDGAAWSTQPKSATMAFLSSNQLFQFVCNKLLLCSSWTDNVRMEAVRCFSKVIPCSDPRVLESMFTYVGAVSRGNPGEPLRKLVARAIELVQMRPLDVSSREKLEKSNSLSTELVLRFQELDDEDSAADLLHLFQRRLEITTQLLRQSHSQYELLKRLMPCGLNASRRCVDADTVAELRSIRDQLKPYSEQSPSAVKLVTELLMLSEANMAADAKQYGEVILTFALDTVDILDLHVSTLEEPLGLVSRRLQKVANMRKLHDEIDGLGMSTVVRSLGSQLDRFYESDCRLAQSLFEELDSTEELFNLFNVDFQPVLSGSSSGPRSSLLRRQTTMSAVPPIAVFAKLFDHLIRMRKVQREVQQAVPSADLGEDISVGDDDDVDDAAVSRAAAAPTSAPAAAFGPAPASPSPVSSPTASLPQRSLSLSQTAQFDRLTSATRVPGQGIPALVAPTRPLVRPGAATAQPLSTPPPMRAPLGPASPAAGPAAASPAAGPAPAAQVPTASLPVVVEEPKASSPSVPATVSSPSPKAAAGPERPARPSPPAEVPEYGAEAYSIPLPVPRRRPGTMSAGSLGVQNRGPSPAGRAAPMASRTSAAGNVSLTRSPAAAVMVRGSGLPAPARR